MSHMTVTACRVTFVGHQQTTPVHEPFTQQTYTCFSGPVFWGVEMCNNKCHKYTGSFLKLVQGKKRETIHAVN